jgi:hypothetical protein
MAVRLSRERLDEREGVGDAYVIPAAEADATAETARMYAVVGLALAVILVAAGIASVFAGVMTSSGKVSIPLPGGAKIEFDGTPIGVVFVALALAFFWISRPQVTKE